MEKMKRTANLKPGKALQCASRKKSKHRTHHSPFQLRDFYPSTVFSLAVAIPPFGIPELR